MPLKQLIGEQKDRVIKIRRDLHQIPEVAFTEEKTAAYIIDYLNELNLPVQSGISEYGVVATLETGRPGPTLMIRADMDALPIAEETGLSFASRNKNVMHACGHDAHMAMALGAATILCAIKDRLQGNIKFVFQPAEEGPGGAKPMIEAGVLDNPKVDFAVGCHVWPEIDEGTIGVKPGPLMAAMSRFDLKITGKGGHGAMPHLCVDALEVGCQVVNALQRIVSRQMNPIFPTVVTVGRFCAGTTFNVIPETAEMCGTVRTFDRDIWLSWPQRLERVIEGVCRSMNAEYEFDFSQGYPPTINDNYMAEVVHQCAAKVVGEDNIIEPELTMGGEDMAFFLEKVKGCFFCIGVGRPGGVSVHNPRFDFNEDVMPLGVETFCRVALELLGYPP